jgi:hypothetical protein
MIRVDGISFTGPSTLQVPEVRPINISRSKMKQGHTYRGEKTALPRRAPLTLPTGTDAAAANRALRAGTVPWATSQLHLLLLQLGLPALWPSTLAAASSCSPCTPAPGRVHRSQPASCGTVHRNPLQLFYQ